MSNQEKETPRIKRLLKEGKLAYINKATLPSEFTASTQGDQSTIPSEVSYSESKDTTTSPENQTFKQENNEVASGVVPNELSEGIATERLASLAEETEDVAREDQIILREGAEMAMAIAKNKSADKTVSPNNSDHPAAISSADGANKLVLLEIKIARSTLKLYTGIM